MDYYIYPNKCILCDNRAKQKHILCTQCFIIYKEYMHEEWFLELVKLQRIQKVIDRNEHYNLPFNIETCLQGKQISNESLSKKNKGKQRIDYRVIQRVLDIYDNSAEDVLLNKSARIITYRQLSKQSKVALTTCYFIIKRYRKQPQEVNNVYNKEPQ